MPPPRALPHDAPPPAPEVAEDDLLPRLLAGERAALARAITLVESKRPDHRVRANALVQAALPHAGGAVRLGVTGAPGVGKSTFIDALGSTLTAGGRRVAVLAVDPSSGRTGGSILGDKTRMARLAHDPNAFVRPSPAGATLGGVAARTREALLLCEAAGFDAVIVETVGVGQSETAVADMTDLFLVLLLPGGGDELQGIKKGVVERADILAVNKADAEGAGPASATASAYRGALGVLAPADPAWRPPVLAVSGLTGEGLEGLWAEVERHRAVMTRSGALDARRRAQGVRWMWALIDDRLAQRLRGDPRLRARLPRLEAAVASGALSPALAADEVAGLAGL